MSAAEHRVVYAVALDEQVPLIRCLLSAGGPWIVAKDLFWQLGEKLAAAGLTSRAHIARQREGMASLHAAHIQHIDVAADESLNVLRGEEPAAVGDRG